MSWLWSIVGNNDSWPPPPWFTRKRYWMAWVFGVKLGWLARNPFHNLTRYRWGWKGKSFKLSPLNGDTWNPDGGFNHVTLWRKQRTHHFFSYRGKYIEYYYGWRPSDGAFGITLRRAGSK